jgi:hypothetical protein
MWIYWALFLWPALVAIGFEEIGSSPSIPKRSMVLLAIFLILIVGLRFEVGMDWGNYLLHLDEAESLGLLEAVLGSDPAYGVLNWIAATLGAGIWLVNVICAAVFVSGMFVFCRGLPNPWLALAVGMPYMAIVMAMNYTRQGAAFGLVLWALVALQDAYIRRFVIFILIATLFHKSALILLPLGVLGSVRNRLWTIAWIGISFTVAYQLFLAEYQQSIFEGYIEEQYASDGAAARVAMNSVAAIVFLVLRNRFEMPPLHKALWTWISFGALLFIPGFALSPSSTAVDRVALYFMPVQLVAFGYLPVSAGTAWLRRVATLAILVSYGIVLYVWFTYSNFYFAWLPYRFYPLEVL